MARAALFLLILAALAASGWTLVQKGFRPTTAGGTLPSAAEAATLELQTAAGMIERYHRTFGSYEGAELDVFSGLRVARAGETTYCLEVAREGGVWRFAGPGGTVAAGAC